MVDPGNLKKRECRTFQGWNACETMEEVKRGVTQPDAPYQGLCVLFWLQRRVGSAVQGNRILHSKAQCDWGWTLNSGGGCVVWSYILRTEYSSLDQFRYQICTCTLYIQGKESLYRVRTRWFIVKNVYTLLQIHSTSKHLRLFKCPILHTPY